MYNWLLIAFGFVLPSIKWLLNDFQTLKTIRQVFQILILFLDYIFNIIHVNIKQCTVIYFLRIFQWKKDDGQENDTRRKEIKKEIRVMLASFYGVWITYVMVALLTMIGYVVHPKIHLASVIITKFGVFINPYIFVFRNKEVSMQLIEYKHTEDISM